MTLTFIMRSMFHISGRFLAISLALVLAVSSPGAGDIFTSTQKIIDMAASEGALLDSLTKYISSEYDNLNALSKFLLERSTTFQQSSEEDLGKLAQHPNGAYLLLHFFSRHWTPLVNARPGINAAVGTTESSLPTEEDYQGALSSLIRLQHVYNLSPTDMYAGNYLGHQGPALRPADTYLLGRRAYMDGLLVECIQWLSLCRQLLEQEKERMFAATHNVFGQQVSESVTLSQAVALLGRAYFYMYERDKALEMYTIASPLEPEGGDVTQLKKELDGQSVPYGHKTKPWDYNMTMLCLRPKHQPVEKILPLHVCRYKQAFGTSYLRYKEEILSIQPYASVFYDILHDGEIDAIKQYIKGKTFRGRIGQGETAKIDSYRISDLGWIHDNNLTTAAQISQRVKIITGLEVDQRQPDGPSSAEAMQVVNYGLGGHYDAHTDPFHKAPSEDILLNRSGARIATFLIYLSDVEVGGNTVFLKAGISVAPMKRKALFWYNFAPHMKHVDGLTEHAGCPVLVGQKWIANKWIWTYGNTFLRPCGLHPNSTQMHVERLMTRRPF